MSKVAITSYKSMYSPPFIAKVKSYFPQSAEPGKRFVKQGHYHPDKTGYDWHQNMDVSYESNGKFSVDVLTE